MGNGLEGALTMTEQKSNLPPAAGDAMAPAAALARVQGLLIEAFRDKPVRIYEAGGGSLSVLPLTSFDVAKVSVVDIDEVQLRENTYADEKILGNVETHVFPANSFDLVVCHNVIEHLTAVDQAIRQFYAALGPGGLLFISAPNPESLFGLITKHSPHWFHVWVYRVILGHKNAGKPGQHPFPTVYHPIVSPNALLEFCSTTGFEVVYFNKFLSKNFASLQEVRPVLGGLLAAVFGALDALTFNKLSLMLGDYHAVLRKPTVNATS